MVVHHRWFDSPSGTVPAVCLWFLTWWWPPGQRPPRQKPGRKWPTEDRRRSPWKWKLLAAWSRGWTEGNHTDKLSRIKRRWAVDDIEKAWGKCRGTWQCSTSSGKTWMTDFGPPWAPKRSSSSMASRAACSTPIPNPRQQQTFYTALSTFVLKCTVNTELWQ